MRLGATLVTTVVPTTLGTPRIKILPGGENHQKRTAGRNDENPEQPELQKRTHGVPELSG
jgi:hypothetical protein